MVMERKSLSSFVGWFVALVVVLTACGGGSEVEAGGQPDPEPDESVSAPLDGEWTLDFLVVEGDMAIVLPGDPIHLTIDGDRIGGSAGCNSVGGTATFGDDGVLAIADLAQTEMACADQSLMDFEAFYTQALGSVTMWRLDGDALVFEGQGSTLRYVPRVAPPDAAVVGTTWILDTFFDGDAAMNSSDMAGVAVTFSDGGVSMGGPCWSISGFATIEPGGEGNLRVDLSASDPDFSCDDRPLFGDMMDRMGKVEEYSIEENRLTLGAGGEPIVSFVAG